MSGIEALLAGRTLADRYRIEEVIGRGGMGAVYRATDERLGRPVALKVVTASAGGEPGARERMRARFRHEAASAGRLPHHPNVVPVYDYGTDPTLGLDFIVMELLRGEDLASRLARTGPPALGTSLRILREAARGVAVGHRAGLIHRDVKPGNVFLAQGDDAREIQVRVLDFGIAKAVAEEETASGLTQDGRAPLSPGYASPEQLRGEPRLTPASDVFSLGALAFQLLTGQRPFTEQDRNRFAAGMEVPLPSLRARNPAVPQEVDALVARAMAPNPADRFENAGAMADALDAAIRRLPEAAAGARVPAGAPIPPVDRVYGDDRTMLAGAADDEDRTILAPPPVHGAAAAPGYPPAAAPSYPPATSRPAQPVIPPRRAPEPQGGGAGRAVAVGALLVVLGGGGVFAYQQMNQGGDPSARPLSELADSAQSDSAGGDSIDPTDALALQLEGRRAMQARDFETAADFYRRASEAAPENVSYRDNYAYALLQLGRNDEAERVLVEAIRINPNYDLLHSHLADALLIRGDTAGAIQSLSRFVQLTPDRAAQVTAQQRMQALTQATQPAPPPPQTYDSAAAPAPAPPAPDTSNAPRDTIRMP
ncbi:MAG TPA: serine/threonine-protein kinase [Longimicrobium sp.]|jgi:serine/threonine-protein kinase